MDPCSSVSARRAHRRPGTVAARGCPSARAPQHRGNSQSSENSGRRAVSTSHCWAGGGRAAAALGAGGRLAREDALGHLPGLPRSRCVPRQGQCDGGRGACRCVEGRHGGLHELPYENVGHVYEADLTQYQAVARRATSTCRRSLRSTAARGATPGTRPGSSYRRTAAMYAGVAGATGQPEGAIHDGVTGDWGPIPTPAQREVPDTDRTAIAAWIRQQ
jgi:hypothetical protein